jgi:hypothetical protein
MSFLGDLNKRHENLKKFVHEGMRYPLPPVGQKFMAFVYFSIPVIGGFAIYNWVVGKAHASIGEHGELLADKQIKGIGNKTVDEDGTVRRVGAGGWGGGVHLAVSDSETQRKNQVQLKKFLRRQKKLLEKQEKE